MATSARALATAVVLLHLAFVAFVIAGGMLALRWPRVAWIHVPAALWGAVIALGGWICPLTPFENWLRVQGGQTPYATGFLEHYLLPILYPVAMTRQLQLATGIFVVALNGLVYWRVLRRHLKRRLGRRAASPPTAGSKIGVRGTRWHSVGNLSKRSREVKHVQDPRH